MLHAHRSFTFGCRLVMLALVTAVPATALAQQPTAPRPAGGLFGDTRSDTADRHRLNITLALLEAFDSVPPPAPGSALILPGLLSDGYSTTLTGSADYARTRRRTQLAGTAQTSFRYYQSVNQIESVSHTAGLGASFKLPRTASFRVNQSAAYSPSYLFDLFPATAAPALGDAINAPPDYRILRGESYSYRSEMGFTMGTVKGTRVNASGSYNRTDFAHQPTLEPTLETSSARAGVGHGVGRNGILSGAYEYRTGTFGLGGTSTEHRLEFGMEYSRALSRGRRSTIRINIAPSRLEADEFIIDDRIAGPVFRTQGHVSVDYLFRRTWRASGSVQRAVEYVAVLAEPVLSNSGSFGLQGLLTRRIDLLATAGYATGASVVNAGQELGTYTGNVRLRFALSRTVALYTEYLHYYYDLRGQQGLAPNLPRTYEQRGVRLGVTLWASVF